MIGPATPGFLVTLGATALLGLVSFGVPFFQSIFFLKAEIPNDFVNGTLTLGTLGFCLARPDVAVVCSKPAVGYKLDVNELLDIDLDLVADIPDVLVKWITYVLILHIIGLGFAAISAIFGFLAHFPTFGMTLCSSLISGIAAAVAMLAFIFDIVLFFLAKKGIEGIGGKAEMGIAIWLTLAAWLFLLFTGCFYAFGRMCIPDLWEEEEARHRRDVEKGRHY